MLPCSTATAHCKHDLYKVPVFDAQKPLSSEMLAYANSAFANMGHGDCLASDPVLRGAETKQPFANAHRAPVARRAPHAPSAPRARSAPRAPSGCFESFAPIASLTRAELVRTPPAAFFSSSDEEEGEVVAVSCVSDYEDPVDTPVAVLCASSDEEECNAVVVSYVSYDGVEKVVPGVASNATFEVVDGFVITEMSSHPSAPSNAPLDLMYD